MNVLVTGGAGYIGSHVVKQLLETTTHKITVIDNLSTGTLETIKCLKEIASFEFVVLDLKEFDEVAAFLEQKKFDTIIHFAASIVVPESIVDPLKYYMNNTVNTTHLIKRAVENGVKRFIFSSTAAVYGNLEKLPEEGIDESCSTGPINPYGSSKLMSEQVLKDTSIAYQEFNYVIFRYFNVAGADMHYDNGVLSPRIGQSFQNATNLIKIVAECAAGKRDKVAVFGDDYDTPDGTGIRDYIHVDDLADAHIKAIDYLTENESNLFNIGYGKGYSVKEVIETMKRVTSVNFKEEIAPRRDADIEVSIANNMKMKEKMRWEPRYNDLALICHSAYLWEKQKKEQTN